MEISKREKRLKKMENFKEVCIDGDVELMDLCKFIHEEYIDVGSFIYSICRKMNNENIMNIMNIIDWFLEKKIKKLPLSFLSLKHVIHKQLIYSEQDVLLLESS